MRARQVPVKQWIVHKVETTVLVVDFEKPQELTQGCSQGSKRLQ